MSNKFWKKKEQAEKDFELEKLTDESLPVVNVGLQTDLDKGTELTRQTKENEDFQNEMEAKYFNQDEVKLLLKEEHRVALVEAIETFTTHKSNMLDDFKTDEAVKAAKWLKGKLIKKGYEV